MQWITKVTMHGYCECIGSKPILKGILLNSGLVIVRDSDVFKYRLVKGLLRRKIFSQ